MNFIKRVGITGLPQLATVWRVTFLALLSLSCIEQAQARGTDDLQSVSSLQLGLNQSTQIHLRGDATDVVVANPDVASAVVRSPRDIYVLGKSVGQTNLVAIDKNGSTIGDISIVVERSLTPLRKALKTFLPGAGINVELLNDNVVLSGSVSTAGQIERAVSLAEAFMSEPAKSSDLSSAMGGSDAPLGSEVGSIPKKQSRIINLLNVQGGQQVTLRVTVAEVNRNITKQLGVNFIKDPNNSSGVSFNLLDNAVRKGFANVAVGSTLAAYINAMETAGVMKILAEPTLTAISGESARFKVGGEYNVINSLVDNGRSSSSLSKIEYGIGLEFVPVVLSPGRISLKVVTDISEPDDARKERQSGADVIQMNRRFASSTVELPSGGSMMIAGLIQDKMGVSRDAVPGVSKLPIVGAMFRNDVRKRSEKELVIIVTPFLSGAVPEANLARPTDNLDFATDESSVLLGQINKVYGKKSPGLKGKRLHGTIGYINK
ncbi:type II and III secretion system protein family protein [Brucella intermedia]|uniref:type II and III secretion system protein family protein n=1 Tax=Brucella intermedia TaxID=94625 RepID=UPI000468137C|nr:type II and III secretion system protein family protein [Brucella intermedia]